MPIDVDTNSDVESFYARAAAEGVTWLDTVEYVPQKEKNFSPAGTRQSENWSGWQIGGGTASAGHYAQAAWNVPITTRPTYAPGPTLSNYMSGTWVGLGCGAYNVNACNANFPLIQAGVQENVNAISGIVTNYFFYEVWPADPVYIPATTLSMLPNDQVAVTVFWMPDSGGAQMGLCNFTQNNKCINFYVYNVPEPGNTVEWIHEAPTAGGNVQAIPAFTQINFNNACWAPTTTYSIQNGSLVGSVSCQGISTGVNQMPLQMYTNGYATPTAIGSTGADFSIYNGQ
jgi:hypothetical protein